jgi:dTDP-4-amino-4,6-dideoxygalactose transaminase
MANQGKIGDCFRLLGFNYRMDEMSGALGLSQMGRLDEILRLRWKLAQHYHCMMPDAIAEALFANSYFVYVVILPNGTNRAEVIRFMRSRGIETRAYFNPIHKEPYMRDQNWRAHGSLAIAEDMGSRCLALPFYHSLTDAEMRHVCRALADSLRAQGESSGTDGTRGPPLDFLSHIGL